MNDDFEICPHCGQVVEAEHAFEKDSGEHVLLWFCESCSSEIGVAHI